MQAVHKSSEPPPKPKRFSMIRSYVLADLFTMGNAACGMAAILLCLDFIAGKGNRFLWTAFVLLPMALLFDGFDGYVARKTRKSYIGADLDSLADIVSFGVAPAVLGFTLGLRGMWDSLILGIFVVCGISRLARYNVTAADLSDERGKVKYFEGTPIPFSLLIVVVLGIAFARHDVGPALWLGAYKLGPWWLHPLSFMYAISGSLMISTIRVPKP